MGFDGMAPANSSRGAIIVRVPDESAINEIPRNPFFQREIREIREVAVDEVEVDADERDAQVEPNRRRTTDQAVEIVALQHLESTDG